MRFFNITTLANVTNLHKNTIQDFSWGFLPYSPCSTAIMHATSTPNWYLLYLAEMMKSKVNFGEIWSKIIKKQTKCIYAFCLSTILSAQCVNGNCYNYISNIIYHIIDVACTFDPEIVNKEDKNVDIYDEDENGNWTCRLC